ncbi:MAG: ArsR/SmtB family transcription factor [Myxococcota bacterium]
MHPIFQRLQVFSDPNRIRLLRILQISEFTVGELTTILEVSQPTVSRHLKHLLEQNLVERRSEGTAGYYQSTLSLRSTHDQQIYQIVLDEYKEHEDDDLRRAESILALRSIDTTRFFQNIGARWHELRHALFGGQYLLPTLLQLIDPKTVIADIGCGSGETLALLAKVSQKVIGIDQSAEMLTTAARNCANFSNIELRSGRAEGLPLQPKEADVVLCMLLLHHIDNIDAAFKSIAHGLSDKGRVIILDLQPHHQRELKQQLGHQHLGFSQADLETASASEFELVHYIALPEDPSAIAPPLFIACFQKRSH